MAVFIDGSRKAVFDLLHRKRRCVRCQRIYTEHDNLGRWQCKRFHPAENEQRGKNGEFTCCSRREGAPGCVSADHTDDDATPVGDDASTRTLIRPDAFAMLGSGGGPEQFDGSHLVVDSSWHELENAGWLVDRVDLAAAARALNPDMRAAAAPVYARADWRPIVT